MSCIPFWLDDPIEAIKNLSSLIPRNRQCINEKLNSLSFFSIVFSAFLWVMKVSYSWVFGVFGVLSAVLLKLLFFDKELGEMTIDEYKTISMGDLQNYLPDEEVAEQILPGEEMHYIKTTPHLMEGTDGTWESMKGSVIDDLVKGRIPMVVPLAKRMGDICIV